MRILSLSMLTLLMTVASGWPQSLPKIGISSFDKPSFGHSTAALIEANDFDKKNGIEIEWRFKKGRAANMDFAAGRDEVTLASALLSEANRRLKGVKSVCLFNVLNMHGALLTADPSIRSLKDLEGKKVAANTVTTNYAMFRYFAKKAGVDMNKVEIQSSNTPGLATYLMSGRADAVHVWEPNYSKLMITNPGKFHMVEYVHDWNAIHGKSNRGFICIAAQENWINKNKKLIPKLYAAFNDLAAWLPSHHDEAAEIVHKAAGVPKEAFLMALKENRYRLDVVPAEQIQSQIADVFKAGVESGYMKAVPDDGIIYKGLK